MFKKEKGITLISLVITIVILLILAGVAISIAVDSNGLFGKAQKAADDWNASVSNEKTSLDKLLYELDKQTEGTDIYVTLYEDGTLAFNTTGKLQEGKTVEKEYGNIANISFDAADKNPWYADNKKVLTVEIEERIVPVDTMRWFVSCINLTEIKNIEKLDTSLVTNMNRMFHNCYSITNIDVSNFDTRNVTNMGNMFYACVKLTSIDVSNFDTRNVTDMSYMFGGNIAEPWDLMDLTEIKGIENFNTSNVTTMKGMFDYCQKLEKLDLSNFDTRKVTDMSYMFYGFEKLTSLDLSNFNTSNVNTMAYMFGEAYSLTEIKGLETFATNNVVNMNGMFMYCQKLASLDLSSFDISNVTTMKQIFKGCKALEYIYVGEDWQYKEGVDKTDMFTDCKATDVTLKSTASSEET